MLRLLLALLALAGLGCSAGPPPAPKWTTYPGVRFTVDKPEDWMDAFEQHPEVVCILTPKTRPLLEEFSVRISQRPFTTAADSFDNFTRNRFKPGVDGVDKLQSRPGADARWSGVAWKSLDFSFQRGDKPYEGTYFVSTRAKPYFCYEVACWAKTEEYDTAKTTWFEPMLNSFKLVNPAP